jgi:hypothetical protein
VGCDGSLVDDPNVTSRRALLFDGLGRHGLLRLLVFADPIRRADDRF